MAAPASFGSPYSKVGIVTANNVPECGFYNTPGGVVTITTSANVTAPATAIDDIGTKERISVGGNKYFMYLVPGVDATNNALFVITQPVYTGSTLTTPGKIDFAAASTAGTKKCRVAFEDQDGMVYEQVLTIVVAA